MSNDAAMALELLSISLRRLRNFGSVITGGVTARLRTIRSWNGSTEQFEKSFSSIRQIALTLNVSMVHCWNGSVYTTAIVLTQLSNTERPIRLLGADKSVTHQPVTYIQLTYVRCRAIVRPLCRQIFPILRPKH
jgi:hypothetical protein